MMQRPLKNYSVDVFVELSKALDGEGLVDGIAVAEAVNSPNLGDNSRLSISFN
jgi:hypothetical protein